MTLSDELAEVLEGLPQPASVEPVWYTAGLLGSAIPSVFTTPDGRVVPLMQVYVGLSKPAGGACSVPYSNRQRYLDKSYLWTGEWFDWDEWSQDAAYRHRWHGFGPSWPGQSASPPRRRTTKAAAQDGERPALSPTPAEPPPTLIGHGSREV